MDLEVQVVTQVNQRNNRMKKSEITKNLKQIKKLLEEDAPMIAKERINFLIDDITKKETDFEYQGRSRKQVENNYKALGVSVIGLFITILGIIIYGLITV